MNPFSFKDHLQKQAQAKTVLVKMLEKILKAKASGAVNAPAIAENEEMLRILIAFVNSDENIPLADSKCLQELLNETFQSGFAKAKKESEESIQGHVPNKYFDREAFRAYHEGNVRELEPHLF